MDYFILILIVLITNCELGECTTVNPHIIFTKLSSSEKPLDTHTQYTVVANKPMCYHFQNMSISRGWCFDYYVHEEILDQEELPAMIQCHNVTYEMSTMWKCNVTENDEKPKKTKYQTFYFNLHVKSAKTVEVAVNGKELIFSEAELSVPYDGDTSYVYEDGEHVQIVCRNPQSTGTVHLEYLTKDVTYASNSATFGIQLHSGNNDSYIDCVYNATKPADRYVYRVTFVTSKRLFNVNEKTVEVAVNGKELIFSEAELSVPYDGDTSYVYEDGEHVQIVCRNPQSTGTVHLEYLTKDVTNASNSATFGIQLHSGNNDSYIDCVYNATKPADRYVYRVTFVTSKRLFNVNEIKTGNQDETGESSSLIIGSSIGAMLVVLVIAGVACWYTRTRTKLIEAPYMTYHSASLTQQYAIEWENQYNTCYDIPENVQNTDPKDHFYTEIDYLTCKPKIEETQTRNSRVYDEPYVQITMVK